MADDPDNVAVIRTGSIIKSNSSLYPFGNSKETILLFKT